MSAQEKAEVETDNVDLGSGKVQIALFNKTDAGLDELRKKYSVVPDAGTKDGYELVAAGAKKLTTLRTSIEKLRVEVKKPYLDAGKAIDREAKRITAELVKLEDPLKSAKKLVDDEEKRKKEERIARLQKKIDAEIVGVTSRAKGQDSAAIADLIAEVDGIDTLHDFYDLTSEATEARSQALGTLNDMYNDRLQFEIAEAERVELEKENARLEEEKIINERINTLKMIPSDMLGKSSDAIAARIEQVSNFKITGEDFGDRADEVKLAVSVVITQLTSAKVGAEAIEQQEAEAAQRLEEQRAGEETQQVKPQAAEPVEQQEAEQVVEPATATERDNSGTEIDFTITDLNQVPSQFVNVDMTGIRQALENGDTVPGVKEV